MHNKILSFGLIMAVLITSCSTTARIRKSARGFYKDTSLAGAHVGISIFDPSKNRFLYNQNADDYFVPASNTKIFTCYLALKYLGDSVAGIRYTSNDTATFLFPTGDPTFLHADFKSQPV